MRLTKRLFSTATINMTGKKRLWIVRHGQAAHNPRAEAKKDAGCTHEEFLQAMLQDDVFDAPLTELGRQQALSLGLGVKDTQSWDECLDLIVSSPLSRALETGDVIVPPNDNCERIKRVCVEDFREVNGWLLNAKRRNVSELQELFPSWDYSEITPTDELWTEKLEEQVDCGHRGYDGLCWLLNRSEDNILLVCHGGILRFTMNLNPSVVVVDARTESSRERDVKGRFGNCELRRYELDWGGETNDQNGAKPTVVLTEVDL